MSNNLRREDLDGRELCSIVLPVFNEEDGILYFHAELVAEISKLTSYYFEIIYVDDGSTDSTYQKINGFKKNQENHRVLIKKLSRNFGHQSAILAGLESSAGKKIVTMDSDGQDPPNCIGKLLEASELGYEIVYAKRTSRKGESAFKKVSAFLFYRLLSRISDSEIQLDTGDFRLVSRKALEAILRSQDQNLYLRGLVSWVGFKSTSVEYLRDERRFGKTKYPLRKMIELALRGVASFSVRPLRISFYGSGVVATLSMFGSIYLIVEKIINPEDTIPGYTTLAVLLLWSLTFQLFCIGLIGEYVGRSIQESRQRPQYILDEEEN